MHIWIIKYVVIKHVKMTECPCWVTLWLQNDSYVHYRIKASWSIHLQSASQYQAGNFPSYNHHWIASGPEYFHAELAFQCKGLLKRQGFLVYWGLALCSLPSENIAVWKNSAYIIWKSQVSGKSYCILWITFQRSKQTTRCIQDIFSWYSRFQVVLHASVFLC